MAENDDIDESEIPEDGAAGAAVRRRRVTIGARATLLLGLSMGTIVAVTAVVSPAYSSVTVSRP